MWIILEAPSSTESGNFEIDTIAYFRRSALRTRLTNVLPGGEGAGPERPHYTYIVWRSASMNDPLRSLESLFCKRKR